MTIDITGEGRLLLTPRGVLWRKLIRQLMGAPEDAFKSAVLGPFLVEVPEGLELPPYAKNSVDRRLMNLLRGISGSEAMVHDLAPRREGEPVVIGRSEQTAQVVLDSKVVSKRHAEVIHAKGGWRVRDLESANGTFCEGRRLSAGVPSLVESGERLRFTKWRGVLLSPDHLFTLAELATKQTTVAGGGLSREALHATLRKRPTLSASVEAKPKPKPAAEPKRKAEVGRVSESGRIPKGGAKWIDALGHARGLSLDQISAGPFLVEFPEGALGDGKSVDPTARVSLLKQGDLSTGRVFSLEPAQPGESTLIGRVACDVELGNSETSRRHSKFSGGEPWTLIDLESANGTYVEERKLPAGIPTRVKSGQSIRFSGLRFLLLSREHYYSLVKTEAATSKQDVRRHGLMRQLLETPPEGLPLRELVEIVGGFEKEEFIKYCEARFLLQVPVVLPGAEEEPAGEEEELAGTQQLSRTRILSLQRSKKISHAKVHTVYPPEEGGLTAGRQEGCDMVLAETSVSKRHVQFRHTKRGWNLIDLDSHNGTFIEGKQVPPNVLVELKAGANISLASYCALWLSPPMVHRLLSYVAKERGK
jgi:pSer/pThr/pTyr-binding forkhead associated (FHA) protein